MPLSPVMVELRASIGEFKAKMAEAREEVRKLADDGARNHERFASFGKAALLGLAGVAVAVGTVSLEMADRYEKSHARLEAAMKGAGTSFEAYRPQIEKTQKQMEKFGYTNADTQAALAQFTVSLKDPAKGLAEMGLAADLAKFKNIPLADSALVVAKAMEGQLRPLKALGIDLPVAAAGALRLEKAHAALAAAQDKVNALLEKYPGAVNAANKHHAMYEAATAKVTAAQAKLKDTMGETAVVLKALHERLGGQAAAAAETFGGKVLAMKTQADDFAKNLGLMLIPILEKLMTVITKTIDWFKQHREVALALAAVVGTLLVGAIVAAGVAFVAALSPVILMTAALAALAVGVAYCWNHFRTFRSIVEAVLAGTAAAALVFSDRFLKMIETLIKGMMPFAAASDAIFGTHFKRSLKGAVDSIESFRQSVHDSLTKTVETAKMKAEAIAINIHKPLFDRLPEYQATARRYHRTIEEVLDAAGVTAKDKAILLSNNIIVGVRTGLPGILSTSQQLAGVPGRAFRDSEPGAYAAALGMGNSLGQGLIAGISAYNARAQAAANNLGTLVVRAVGSPMKMASPSKATRYMGEMLGEGLAVGIEAKSLIVQNAGRTLGRRAVEATAASVGAGIPADLSRGAGQLGGAAQGMAAGGLGGRLSAAPQQTINVTLNGANMTPAAVATEVAWQMKTRAA